MYTVYVLGSHKVLRTWVTEIFFLFTNTVMKIVASTFYLATVLYIHNEGRLWLPTTQWLIGTVRAEPETVISRAWVQSPDPAE